MRGLLYLASAATPTRESINGAFCDISFLCDLVSVWAVPVFNLEVLGLLWVEAPLWSRHNIRLRINPLRCVNSFTLFPAKHRY